MDLNRGSFSWQVSHSRDPPHADDATFFLLGDYGLCAANFAGALLDTSTVHTIANASRRSSYPRAGMSTRQNPHRGETQVHCCQVEGTEFSHLR